MQDPGAQLTAVSDDLKDELQLQGVARTSVVEGIGGHKTVATSLFTKITLTSSSKLVKRTIEVRTIRKPVGVKVGLNRLSILPTSTAALTVNV